MSTKNPNKSPEKGFIAELTSKDVGKSAPQKENHKFSWSKPVAGGAARPNTMNVPRRLKEQTKVGRPKSNIVAEAKAFAVSKKK